LADSPEPSRGRVEVYDEYWISVCYNYMNIEAQLGMGQAVCRQMGYYNVFAVGNVTTFE
jgi:hypothetical protein